VAHISQPFSAVPPCRREQINGESRQITDCFGAEMFWCLSTPRKEPMKEKIPDRLTDTGQPISKHRDGLRLPGACLATLLVVLQLGGMLIFPDQPIRLQVFCLVVYLTTAILAWISYFEPGAYK
jgi:hypothetical protein